MKHNILLFLSLLAGLFTEAQLSQGGKDSWIVVLQRKDGKEIPFRLERVNAHGTTVLYVKNASEQIRITNVKIAGDSMFFTMPTFESSFRVRLQANGDMDGIYIKGTSGSTQYWLLHAYADKKNRFAPREGEAKNNLSGKWDVTITRANGSIRKAVGIFKQKGNELTGSFLTPAADYRYLEGIVTGDSLKLSGFDGDNIHLFEAKFDNANAISGGVFYNGYTGIERWTAKKNSAIDLPKADQPTHLKADSSKLDFTFNNLQGTPVSIQDEQFKNKVVVVQILGSWCANCLDETKFLASYYRKNRSKGVEIIGLAYELTTDTNRSKKSVVKFQKLFNVQYPLLITGVASGDDNKTEKTLPQLTPIRSFPTTIFIDKKGNVREIHTNFYGPASGAYYIESKNKFYETVDSLLREK